MSNTEPISYYMSEAQNIDEKNFEKQLRVAILSSFTINGLVETIKVKSAKLNFFSHIFLGGYNQYNEEILNLKSDLYSFSSDICFLFLDTRKLLGKFYFEPYSVSSEVRRDFINQKFAEITELIDFFIKNSKSKLILNNFLVPTYSPYGIFETKTDFGLSEMVTELNQRLYEYFRDNSSVFIFDFISFVSKIGEKKIFDFRQYFFGDIQISLNEIPNLAHELFGYIKPLIGLNKKCIVLDLDNTLWGGIIGEDGMSGIKLNPNDPVGKSYVEFQKYLLSLHKRGIILAINSKNNFDDAMEVIREHPNMILKEEHFASIKINWENKVSNIKEISQEINIGMDSMVFFDDDPVNRDFVNSTIPEILTIELPNDPSLFIPKLLELNDFNVLKITSEDQQRGKMYLEQRKRVELKQNTDDFKDYLQKLNVKIYAKIADEFTIPRISQLTLKTNQFNLTTKRYQEHDIDNFSKDDKKIVGCIRVEDKFGDNGITGAFIIEKINSSEWYLDTFLLSCRIMGREIETEFLNFIIQEAKKSGIITLTTNYLPTKKNKPIESFLPDHGFIQHGELWKLNVQEYNKKNGPHKLVISNK